MTQYNRVMAGAGGIHAAECVKDGFIGVDYQIAQDLTNDLTDNFREFNAKYIPVYLAGHPGKTKIGAGLACGFTWTVAKGLKQGDIVISPDGAGAYHVGEITGGYFYKPGSILPHRRPVAWYPNTIERSAMSEPLRRSTNSTGTCCDITQYATELKALIGGQANPALVASDPTVEDPAVFALEKYLEDFLVSNWAKTDLGKKYDIYTVDGEQVGQQFQTDTGPVDVLAVSKDGSELLVVELKKGRASDAVVGQIQRYMGYLMDELAEQHQTVKGVIIALEDDLKIRRALRATSNISFYRYQVSFTLIPIQGATST
jgi:restriction system protein